MRKYGLKSKLRGKNPYIKINQKTKEHKVFPNLLKRQFEQDVPYSVICTDITYIKFKDIFLYLSALKDISTGEMVSWNVSDKIDMDLVLNSFDKKINLRGSLIHSDQGFHYTSPRYVKLLKKIGATQSMSRKGNCIDNAPIESFFGHFKDELDISDCVDIDDVCRKVNEYMRYYNHERKQWNRNKMTPVEYRNYLLIQNN